MTWARRIAERDLDCLLLGTAMGSSLDSWGARWDFEGARPANGVMGRCASHLQLAERGGQRIGGQDVPLLGHAGARDLVPVPTAHRADAPAVQRADRVDGKGEQDLVANLRAEVHLVAREEGAADVA